MMKYKSALLVIFYVVFVTSEPLRYRTPVIQNASPKIPIIPSLHYSKSASKIPALQQNRLRAMPDLELALPPSFDAKSERFLAQDPPKPLISDGETPRHIISEATSPSSLQQSKFGAYQTPNPGSISLQSPTQQDVNCYPSPPPPPPPLPDFIPFPSSTPTPPKPPAQSAATYVSPPQSEFIAFSSSTPAPVALASPYPPPPRPFRIEVPNQSYYISSSPSKSGCVELASPTSNPIPLPHFETSPPRSPPHPEAAYFPSPPEPVAIAGYFSSPTPSPQPIPIAIADFSSSQQLLPPALIHDCHNQKEDGSIPEQAIYSTQHAASLPSNDTIVVEAAQHYSSPPPPPPVPTFQPLPQHFHFSPSQLPPSSYSPSLEPNYPSFPSPSPPQSPASPPQQFYPIFPPSPPQYLNPQRNDCIVYDKPQSPVYI